jgi:hypothetical protein
MIHVSLAAGWCAWLLIRVRFDRYGINRAFRNASAAAGTAIPVEQQGNFPAPSLFESEQSLPAGCNEPVAP